MTIVAFFDPSRVGGDGVIRYPVAASAFGGLATGYYLAGFQPATLPTASVMDPVLQTTPTIRMVARGFPELRKAPAHRQPAPDTNCSPS